MYAKYASRNKLSRRRAPHPNMSLPSLAARGTVRPFPTALSFCAATANSSGADLVACACSALTGDEWRGRIAVLDARTLRARASIPSASGVVDLHWIGGYASVLHGSHTVKSYFSVSHLANPRSCVFEFRSDRLLSAYDDGGVYLSRISLAELPPLDECASLDAAAPAASSQSSSMAASAPVPSSAAGAVPTAVEASYLDHDDSISAIAVVPSGSHFMSTSWDCTCV
jgi:hypothetical protein